ncbi:hypothetical protein ACOGYG_000255 [Edwardsiella piscicida]|nr:hypothetical protein [Edwardsiella piscicida]UCQ25196.1 hypothetical protein DCE91_03930 [Edwardsiella piscicida]UCQ35338.1 hypothetical protein DCF34_03930 [Edwardsiella piscicida]UCQ45244.1 hypothetical protein DCF39_03935 [Edwardsiella piscicida]UJT80758.1 hypothetical protein L1P06_03980 [Edwardsiella piscicida]
MANSLLAGANHQARARGTTQSAIADGAIVVRDRANQQQDVAGLARDTERAHQPLSPIFDKEKAQRRLQQAQLIGETAAILPSPAARYGPVAILCSMPSMISPCYRPKIPRRWTAKTAARVAAWRSG